MEQYSQEDLPQYSLRRRKNTSCDLLGKAFASYSIKIMRVKNKIEIMNCIKYTDIFSCLKNTFNFNIFVNFGLIEFTRIIKII